MGSCSKQEVYQNFLEFYREALASGTASPCTGEEQVRRGRHFLNSVPSSGHRFRALDFYRLAREFLLGSGGSQHLGRDGFRGLSKAFELLEMLALNLYLWPWRKEIRSIKTFTGAFVYFIQPVFAPSVLQEILQKLGYVRQGASEYVILKQVNEEEIGQLGFEFFLARAECELMQEMLNKAAHRSCEDIVQLRCTPPSREADCTNLQNAGSRLGEGAVVGNNWSSKSDLPSSEDPDAPLPLMETNTGGIFGGASEASNDPLGSLRTPISDHVDLYSDYNDESVRDHCHVSPLYPEQCNSLLVLDQSLLENTGIKSAGNLSPGQTGPLSLSFYSSSFLVDHQPDGKLSGNPGSDVLSQREPPKSGAAIEECSEVWRHGRSTQSKSPQFDRSVDNWKKDHSPVVEIELKNMDSGKLPYSTAETTDGVLFHQGGHFSASESQEPLAFRGQCQTQLPAACHVPRTSECCLCPPAAFPTGQHRLEVHEFRDGPAQGGSVVREPPQSHYIPPSSPGDRPVPAANACRVCCSPLAPAQPLREDCLHVREVAAGGDSDSYLYISRVACGRADVCRRCQKVPRDPAPSDVDLENLQAGQVC